MKHTYKLLIAAAVSFGGLSSAQAIVVNSGYGAANALADAAQFSNVVRIEIGSSGVCTGSLISATTILTAKHCTSGTNVSAFSIFFDQNGDGTLNGNDQTNSTSGKWEAPAAASPGLIDGTDVAMLTLIGSIPSWIGSLFQKLWDGSVLDSLVTMVGYGGKGENVLTSGAGGSRWAAQNTVDKVGAAGFNQPNSANIISTDFDDGSAGANTLTGSAFPLRTEGTTAGGDSGGPLLVDVDNQWLIAGVLSGGTRHDSGFGDISWWTGIGNYRTEIEGAGGVFYSAIDNTVPEPGSLALVLMALFTAGALGKRRQMI